MEPCPEVSEALKREIREIRKQDLVDAIKSIPPERIPRLILSKSNVLATRSQRAKSILDNYALLKAILDRHEITIHRRWLDNKKPKQRLELIRKAWGTFMAPCHRPDFEAIYRDQEWQQDNKVRVREANMWPYINEEDLLKPRNLLWFMASRGKHHPSSFAATDLQAMHKNVICEAEIFSGQLPDHVMMFTGREDVKRYGELLNICKYPEAAVWLILGQGLVVSAGLLVLEAQERILSFLVACVQLILHDVTDLLQGPKQLAPTLSWETGTGFASLAATANRAPYLPPAQLDCDRIISLLAAARDKAANHLWSLREDPGYFHDHMLELREHRHEMVKSEEPLPPLVFDPSNSKHEIPFWSLVLHYVLATDHMQYEMYAELHTQAQRLRDISMSFAGVIRPEKLLPEPYLHTILRFRYYLKEIFFITTQTKLPYAGSPPWRNHYHRKIIDARTDTEFALRKKPCRLNAVQRRLERILMRFANISERSSVNNGPLDLNSAELKYLGITKIMDELQHFVDSEPEARAMLTPYIASSIGSLATISECLHQLELYQPWANTFDAITEDRAQALESDYKERSLSVEEKVRKALILFDGDLKCSQLGRIGAPTNGRFSYPVWRSKNEETVTLLRKAERDLDSFWNAFDKQIIEKLDEPGESHLQSWFRQPRELRRTPPWVKPLIKKDSSAAQSLHTAVKELDLTRELLTERTIADEVLVAQTKVKVKTRGNVHPVEFGGDDHEDEHVEVRGHDAVNIDAALVHHPRFALNARALKVFKTIFFVPSINPTPGEIAWIDFLYAMKSIGFSPEAMGGSVWNFHPESVDVKHGIVFHSPHPQPKISYQVARRHGRALTRAYGWEGHVFSLA